MTRANGRRVGVMAPKKRQRLLREATAEFARAGYERASLNKVIAACGLSKSSFYHYFASKQALFDAVIMESGAALASAVDVPDPKSMERAFWETVAILMQRLGELSESDPWTLDYGRLFYLDDAPPKGALRRARKAVDAWFTDALAAGRKGGAVRDDLPISLQVHLALAVIRAMDEWTLRHLPSLTDREIQDLGAVQLVALRRLIGAP